MHFLPVVSVSQDNSVGGVSARTVASPALSLQGARVQSRGKPSGLKRFKSKWTDNLRYGVIGVTVLHKSRG